MQAEEPELMAAEAADPDKQEKKPTILIAEDNELNGEILLELLTGAMPVGSDRLVSQYLKQGTKEEIRVYMEGTSKHYSISRQGVEKF